MAAAQYTSQQQPLKRVDPLPIVSATGPLWIQTDPPPTLFKPGTTTITSDTTWARPGYPPKPIQITRLSTSKNEKVEEALKPSKVEKEKLKEKAKEKDKKEKSSWRPKLFFSGAWLHGPSRHKIFASSPKHVQPPPPAPGEPTPQSSYTPQSLTQTQAEPVVS